MSKGLVSILFFKNAWESHVYFKTPLQLERISDLVSTLTFETPKISRFGWNSLPLEIRKGFEFGLKPLFSLFLNPKQRGLNQTRNPFGFRVSGVIWNQTWNPFGFQTGGFQPNPKPFGVSGFRRGNPNQLWNPCRFQTGGLNHTRNPLGFQDGGFKPNPKPFGVSRRGLNQTWNPFGFQDGGFKPNPKPFGFRVSDGEFKPNPKPF